jgi:uncharacterized protein (DUF983 family)
MLWRGLRRKCPQCGSGHLFRRWITMADTCPRCTYRFEREEGFFLGAIVVSVIVTELVIVAIIVLGFSLTLPDTPVGALAIGGGVAALFTPLLIYPFTKTIWTAIDLIMRRSMGESYATADGTQPGTGPRRP